LGYAQIDDMNPGINPYPLGLFWTIAIPSACVSTNPGAGNAIYKVQNAHIQDFSDFNAALSGAPGVPALVSFEVRWQGVEQRVSIEDPDTDFAAEFVRGRAQMEWSAVVGDYTFQSAPIDTSSSDFAEVGTMRNGVFYPRH
jgi:hypothetical protein